MRPERSHIDCRFAELGCRSPAAEIVHVPIGCVCWDDPIQALCHQHLLTIESRGPIETILVLNKTGPEGPVSFLTAGGSQGAK